MNDYLKKAKAIEKQIVAWRRVLHRNAEIGCDLPRTAAFVESVLEVMGIEHCRLFGCGVVAWIGEGSRTILLRADMDALPGNETSGLEFASETGAVHACGHDIHTSMLLGAAKLLQTHRGALHGRAVLMFQPGEENLCGALGMLQDGLLERFRPQIALANARQCGYSRWTGLDQAGNLQCCSGHLRGDGHRPLRSWCASSECN